MSRDHLTPEQRPTKDGNIVTRWVRRHKKQSAASSSIPAPGLPKEKTEKQKQAEEFIQKYGIPANETEDQKTERKAKQKLQASYLKAEGVLRWKYRKDDSIDDYEINDLFKHLHESANIDPASIDETLLRGYSAYKKKLFKTLMDDQRAVSNGTDVEATRPVTATFGAHYANHPEDRESLAAILDQGVTDYDSATKTLSVIHTNPDQYDDIIAYLGKRGGPDGIEEYLAQEVKALREGTL